MKRLISSILASSVLLLGATACDLPEEDDGGTAADRSAANNGNGGSKGDKAEQEEFPNETTSQQNARESAENYLDLSAFSRQGLIDQLKFEDFSVKDATYGVDAQKANWNKQAAASAQNYIDMSSFSRQSLIDQLVFEGYTQAQAEFGVNKVGL